MSKSNLSLPRGTRDFGPQVSSKRNYIIEKIKHCFIKYGFCPLETPAMENLSVLTGKYGEEGDQLLYKILNSGDFLNKVTENGYHNGSKYLGNKISKKGLRYDLTVPFARFVVMNQHKISFPFKRYQIQPVWRADRPQKSRYREFYQCDADIVGSKGIWNEIELTLLMDNVLTDLKLEDYIIKINHREILFLLAEYTNLKDKAVLFIAEIDKLDKIGHEKVTENILALGGNPSKIKEAMRLISLKNGNQLLEQLQSIDHTNTGIKEISDFFEMLDQFKERNLKIELDISLARGLSYYTGIIFEVKPTTVQIGSICGGGRYDSLTSIFGLDGVSGVGVSFGLDRIYDVLETLQLFPKEVVQHIDILIVHFGKSNLKYGQSIVMKLRDAGIKTDIYPEQVKIQKQFAYANKIKVLYTLVIGDDERNSDEYVIKNMQSGKQEFMDLQKIIRLFKG